MAFKEKRCLLVDEESTPLIQNPIIWSRSHEYPMESHRFSISRRKERFHWLIFIGVTLMSLALLITLIAGIVRISDREIELPLPLVPNYYPVTAVPINMEQISTVPTPGIPLIDSTSFSSVENSTFQASVS